MLARNQVATGEMLLQQRHRFAQYAASALFAELAHGALEVHRIGAKGQASAQRRGSSPAGQAAGQLGRHQGIPCHSTAAEPPPRARRHASPFDCGKPPLAADLRTTAFMSAEQSIARLDGLSDQRSAEAYELISMPTAISTIRGAFQAMMLVLGVGRTMMSEIQRISKEVSMHSIRSLSWIAVFGLLLSDLSMPRVRRLRSARPTAHCASVRAISARRRQRR